MGTVLELTLVRRRRRAAPRAAREACFALGAELEAVLTTYDAASATSRAERERRERALRRAAARWRASSPTRSASRARRAAPSTRPSGP